MMLRINNDIEIELISNYEAQTGVLNFVRGSSKVKTPVEIDVEKMNSVNEFVDYCVTENRLNQGIEQVFTCNNLRPDIKNTGDFIKWISKDILKEETDTLVKSDLIWKDVSGVIAKKASQWFKEYLDSNL